MAKSCKRRAEHCSWCSGQGVLILGPDPGSQKAVDPHSFGTPGTGPNIKHLVPLSWNLNVFLSQGKNVAENPLWTHLDSWESQIWVQISPSQLPRTHSWHRCQIWPQTVVFWCRRLLESQVDIASPIGSLVESGRVLTLLHCSASQAHCHYVYIVYVHYIIIINIII